MKFSLKTLTLFSMLTSITAMLQVTGGLLPGIGSLFSGFTTLFVALAGYLKLSGGLMVYFASAGLIGILMPTELPIFLLCTGLLGLVLGCTIKYGQLISTFFSGIVFALSTSFIAYILGIPVFGPITQTIDRPKALIIILLFSWFFSYIWIIMIKRVLKKIEHLLH